MPRAERVVRQLCVTWILLSDLAGRLILTPYELFSLTCALSSD